MKQLAAILSSAALFATGAAYAHHGWGSYDASKTIVIDGKVLESAYEFPHGEMIMEFQGAKWTVTLAPPSRMQSRGLARDDIAVGKTIKAEGYPSTSRKNEMRAERVTAGGKVIEMR